MNAVKDVKANGWYAQAGYMVVPGAWEIAARYSIVDPDTDSADNQKTEAMVGLNHFIGGAGHAMKLTADVAQLTEESSSTVEYKDVRVRIQLQIIY